MVCLLGGPLNGHGTFLVGSADAGALGIVARDHAHTFATMANIAARPGMEINFVDPFSCSPLTAIVPSAPPEKSRDAVLVGLEQNAPEGLWQSGIVDLDAQIGLVGPTLGLAPDSADLGGAHQIGTAVCLRWMCALSGCPLGSV